MATITASSCAREGSGGKGTGIARAAVIMMAATLLSRVLGMARDTIIAAKFGVSADTDAYNAAFKIPDLLSYLIAGGALSSTFVPVFSEYWHHGKIRTAWRTFSIVATVTLILATLFVLLSETFTPQLVRLLNWGYTPAQIARCVPLTRIVLPAQIFFLLGGLLIGTQNARGLFITAAIAPNIYNLGIIAGALIIAPMLVHTGHPISGLMWGALLGAFVGNFLLQLIPVVRLGMLFKPSLALGHPGAVKVWRMLVPILLGVSLPNVDQIINTSFASNLSVGAQTYLTYANRVMLIPIGIFAQAVGIALLPTLSMMAASNRRKEFKRTTNFGLRSILFLTVPATALFYILSVPIVALLYHHGKFTAADVYATAVPLRFYAIGICSWSAQAILTRGFYALQDSRTPVISGTIMTVLFIGMNWVVVNKTHDGVGGLALSTTVAATLHLVVMYYFLRKRLGGLHDGRLFFSILRIGVATALLCVVATHVHREMAHLFSPTASTLHAVLNLAVSGSLGTGAYLMLAAAIRMPELTAAKGLLRRSRPAVPAESAALD